MPTFTPAEKRLLVRRKIADNRDQWGWFFVLAPFAAFALYGLYRKDVVAVFIAWAGTTGVLCWWWLSAVRSSAVLSSILKKYDESIVETRAASEAGR